MSELSKDGENKPSRTDYFNGWDLMQTTFPPARWAIPGILPEGLTLLGGKPKQGKSLLSLNAGIAITEGTNAFGCVKANRGSVIYLALEDTWPRLKSRLNKMLERTDHESLRHLHLFNSWQRMDKGGLSRLDRLVSRAENLRLVIVDTLAMFRSARDLKQSSQYDADYQAISEIKKVADRYQVSILVIHHLRKLESTDVMDEFSGSHGLTGAADNLIVMKGRSGMSDAELHVTGRDVESRKLALSLDRATLRWTLMGDAKDVMATENQQAIYDALRESDQALGPKELAGAIGHTEANVKKVLPKLVDQGLIRKVKYGKYQYTRGNGVDSGDSQGSLFVE
jgi:RecA-family ATPase